MTFSMLNLNARNMSSRCTVRAAKATRHRQQHGFATSVHLTTVVNCDAAPDRLRQRPALARKDLVTRLHAESRRDVDRRVLVPLLETIVLLDVVQVVLADDDGVLHLGRLNHAGNQLSPNVDGACGGRPGARLGGR